MRQLHPEWKEIYRRGSCRIDKTTKRMSAVPRELDVSTCLICLLTGLTDFSNCNSRVWLKANNNRLSFLKLPDFVPGLKTYPRHFPNYWLTRYFFTIELLYNNTTLEKKQNKVRGAITMRFIKLLVKIARTWTRIKLSNVLKKSQMKSKFIKIVHFNLNVCLCSSTSGYIMVQWESITGDNPVKQFDEFYF